MKCLCVQALLLVCVQARVRARVRDCMRVWLRLCVFVSGAETYTQNRRAHTHNTRNLSELTFNSSLIFDAF